MITPAQVGFRQSAEDLLRTQRWPKGKPPPSAGPETSAGSWPFGLRPGLAPSTPQLPHPPLPPAPGFTLGLRDATSIPGLQFAHLPSQHRRRACNNISLINILLGLILWRALPESLREGQTYSRSPLRSLGLCHPTQSLRAAVRLSPSSLQGDLPINAPRVPPACPSLTSSHTSGPP